MHEALALVAGRHHHPLRRAADVPVHPRREGVAGQLRFRHVEPPAHERQRSRKRVPELDHVVVGPLPPRQVAGIVLHRVLDQRVDRRREQVAPRAVARIQQVRRPVGHELPDRAFAPPDPGVVEARVGFVAVGQDERRDPLHHLVAEHSRQQVGGRIGRRLAGPVFLDDLAEPPPRRVAGDRIGVEMAQDQVAPPRQEGGARVELDVEHVGRRELLALAQSVADLARPGAHVVVAVAERREHAAVHDAGVGGPQAAARRIDDPRVLVRRQPAVPAAPAVSPRFRELAAQADAARQGAIDRPADAAAAVGDDHVLRRRAQPVGRFERLFDGARRLERQQGRGEALGRMRAPGIGAEPAFMVGAEHRPPDRPAHVQLHGVAAGHLDGLAVAVERAPAPRRPVAVGVHGVELDQHQIARVHLRVGEPPGHVRVAAGHERRVAR